MTFYSLYFHNRQKGGQTGGESISRSRPSHLFDHTHAGLELGQSGASRRFGVQLVQDQVHGAYDYMIQ